MSIGDERGRIADRARRGRGPLPGPRRPPTPSSSKSSSSSAAAPRPPAAECNREVESLCQRASLSSVGAQEQSGASHPWVPPKTPEGVEKRGTITRRTDSEPGTCGKTFKGFEKTLAMPLINWELCEYSGRLGFPTDDQQYPRTAHSEAGDHKKPTAHTSGEHFGEDRWRIK
ncbi:uncharacterized protein LOC132498418 isoform X3 [Mesoplodon densirostris]|uniref:uncharacterized protein LOC132498418 isoform X3 n=1 Tax=Mesoplodon densirostris TaxID=48708 RepID=UPI0028DC6ABE|nr:uncharacterized protein LOC132498418 isoform X3 [Mesoplodon densirostris]